jgi:hypothetical protein
MFDSHDVTVNVSNHKIHIIQCFSSEYNDKTMDNIESGYIYTQVCQYLALYLQNAHSMIV